MMTRLKFSTSPLLLQQQVSKITEVADSVSYTAGSKMVFPVHYTIYNVYTVADYDQQANGKHDFEGKSLYDTAASFDFLLHVIILTPSSKPCNK